MAQANSQLGFYQTLLIDLSQDQKKVGAALLEASGRGDRDFEYDFVKAVWLQEPGQSAMIILTPRIMRS